MRLTIALFVTAAALLQGCDQTKCQTAGCVEPDGGIVGMGKDPPPIVGGGCDATKTKEEGGCRVTDADGLFVSASGSDGAPGTQGAPLRTISAAIKLAAGARRDVYVCAGTYDDAITVANAGDGVALHGGFSCDGGAWKRTGAATSIKPTKTGPVVNVQRTPVVIEDLEIVARDGAAPSESSVAVIVASSPGATLRRAKITAGRGASGAVGASDGSSLGVASPGYDATISNPGAARTCQCGNLTTIGGNGGNQNTAPGSGSPAIMNAPANAGAAGTQGDCTTFVGKNGAPALDGADGAPASTLGSLSSSGWSPSSGADGLVGGVGQGGGGGAGNADLNGGGGGCGGCGGKGGGGGGAGGGSVGVVSFMSALHLVQTIVSTDRGGDGAAGGAGQQPQQGGSPGQGVTFGGGPYCNSGGRGGAGGAGGHGGAGAGGVSFGVAYAGAAPDVDSASMITVGAPGVGSVMGEAKPTKGF